MDVSALYLTGVYEQGTADLAAALRTFQDPVFAIPAGGPQSDSSPSDSALLAGLNRMWIMQHPIYRDERKLAELQEQLPPFFAEHPDIDVRTAYHIVFSAMQPNPPLSMNRVKQHIQMALSGSQATLNTQFLSFTLNIMRHRLFENVVAKQAVKSAKAAVSQARKSGNVLWMSVADGMLAQSHEMLNEAEEANAAKESGIRFANEAVVRTREARGDR